MATKTVSMQEIQNQFEQAGFTVAKASGDRLEVKKSCCAAFVGSEDGKPSYIQPPYLEVQGLLCELEDRGYQKFWLAKAENRRFPIRKADLLVLHRFDEEVRFVLHLESLYN